jgi:tetratricopeptide (TPR) repeat protein
MSLLMDALKKAEQERKETAKRIKESENSLQVAKADDVPPVDESQVDTDWPEEYTDHTRSESGGPNAAHSATTELSLAPLETQQEATEDKAREQEEGTVEEDDGLHEQDDPDAVMTVDPAKIISEKQLDEAGLSQITDSDNAPPELSEEPGQAEPEGDLDQTFHGLSIEDEDTPEMFEEDVQGDDFEHEEQETKYDETLPGVPAMQLAKDIGTDDQPTPVAAQTVFTAAHTNRGRSSVFKWLLVGSGLVVILAGSVWYYFIVTPISRQLPSPLVAEGVETKAPSVPGIDLRTRLEAAPSSPAKTPHTAAATAPGAASAAAQQPVVSGTAGQAAAAAPVEPESPKQPEEIAPAPTATGHSTAQSAPPAAAVSPAAPAARRTAPEDLPESIELSPAMIRISRSKTQDDQGRQLKQAYSAYQAGDNAAAEAGYEKVLKSRPDNRDALLGLGALAMKNGDENRAVEIYSHLLQINPQDKLVRGIVINMSNKTDPVRSESSLKVMLQDNPDIPFLYFALGNLYASQSRWPDAQQAFFDAYRLDSDNPDYAYNLAVSLDHLGHPDTALDYYKTAMQLAGNSDTVFDKTSLSARIDTLEQAQQQ